MISGHIKSIFAALFLITATTASASPTIETPQGKVTGTETDGVQIFKGIPYAAPPVGEMRWRAPAPAPRWSQARDASSFGPVCVQRAPASSQALISARQSEDCLTANIWRPASAKRAPVMLWLHGGSNRFGSGSEPYYDGSAFARRGIILVTINYRLGHLGFFAHPALGDAGGNLINYGLLDQIAALKWVQANIAAYGGDPAQVTVFGESAGGGAVLNLLAAPSARGLFQRAIVQSGGGLIVRKDAGAANKLGKSLAVALGLKEGDASAAALRALPAERFLDAALPGAEPGFGAVPGGAELAEPPLAAIRAGRAAQVPLIIGANSREGSLVDSWGMKDDQVVALLGGNLPAISDAYGADASDKSAYARRLYGDVVFLYPALAIARAQSAKAPTWLYYFDYVPDGLRAQRKGVNHAAEIPFVFDMNPATALVPRSDKDKAFAAGVNSCFAAFAHAGAPSKAGFCSAWQPYADKQENWFAFRDAPREERGLFKRQLDAIGAGLRKLGLN
jgi:para-nitrobenzyl esterase